MFSRATAASRSAEKGIGHPLISCEGPKPAPAAPGVCLSEFIDDGVCPNIRKIITKCRLRGGVCNYGKYLNITVGWSSRNFGFRVSAGAKLLNTGLVGYRRCCNLFKKNADIVVGFETRASLLIGIRVVHAS